MTQQTSCGPDGGGVPDAASSGGARGAPVPAAPIVRVHELELKLQGTPADLAGLVDLPLVARVRQGPVSRLRQITTYSDTPELELAGRGLALRTREQDGVRRHGLKSLGSTGGLAGIAGRDEWEWPAPASGLSPPADLADLLTDAVQRRLVPLFRTDIRRTVLTVAPNLLTLIEIAVDIGHVATFSAEGGQTMAQVAEVELELKAGRAAELLAFAALLQQALPLRLTLRSKADTALQLRGIRLPRADALPPVFTPATTVAEAFRSTLRQALADLLRADDSLRLDGAPDGGARLRDALVALDSAATLFGPMVDDPALRDLRRNARTLLRRIDRLHGAGLLAAAAGPSPRLAALIEARRRRLAARLDRELRSAAWRQFPLRAAAWLEGGAWREGSPGLDQPLSVAAAALLQRRLQALRLSGLADAGRRGRRRTARRLTHAATALALLRGPAGSAPSASLTAPAAAALASAAAEAADADTARREARRIARSAEPEARPGLARLAAELADRRRRAVARLATLPRR